MKVNTKNNGRYAFMPKKYKADMGLITRKRVIVVYNNIKLNPACLASEPSMKNTEIFHVQVRLLYLPIVKNKSADQSAWMRFCSVPLLWAYNKIWLSYDDANIV